MTRDLGRAALPLFLLCASAASVGAQPKYDLLLRGGHVIDPKNGTSGVRDVAVADGRIAAVAPRIDPAEAAKAVDVSGLYVTPGLIDIHAHPSTEPMLPIPAIVVTLAVGSMRRTSLRATL